MKNLFKKLITLVTLCAMLSVAIITPSNSNASHPNSDDEIIFVKDEQK